MAIGNGRGDANKWRIRNEWDLVPIIHTRLLGQQLRCCCGDPITSIYWRFHAKSRQGLKDDDLIAGPGCAQKLMGIQPAIPPIAMFDPLAQPGTAGGGGHGVGGQGQAMDPLNREIYAVLHLVLAHWGQTPAPGKLFENVLSRIRAQPILRQADFAVLNINDAIGKRGQTFTQILATLRSKNPSLRNFACPGMTAIVRQDGRQSWL